MIEWLRDISGCNIGSDTQILRTIVCEEMLKPWRKEAPPRMPSSAKMAWMMKTSLIGKIASTAIASTSSRAGCCDKLREAARRDAEAEDNSEEEDGMDETGNRTPSSGEVDEDGDIEVDDDLIMVDARPGADGDVTMQDWRQAREMEEDEATLAGYPPPPPPPPPVPRRSMRDRELTPSDSDTAEPLIAPTVYAKAHLDVPKTPGLPKGRRYRRPIRDGTGSALRLATSSRTTFPSPKIFSSA